MEFPGEGKMPYKIHVRTPGEENISSGQKIKKEQAVPAAQLHRLEAMDSRKRRNPLIHWVAIVLALLSLGLLIFGMIAFNSPLTLAYVWLDLALSLFFFVEFFTRSGLRWHGGKYILTHLFDFVAIVPVFLFLYHGVFAESLWVWLVLIARAIRSIDRILSDGFFEHNIFALVEGLEAEITDCVVLRIMERIRKDLVAGKLGHSSAKVLENNKASVLRRVREQYPETLGSELARFVGLETAIEGIEDRIYDSAVELLASPEVNEAIQEEIDVIFAGLKADIGKNEWRKHLGFQHAYQHAETAKLNNEKAPAKTPES